MSFDLRRSVWGRLTASSLVLLLGVVGPFGQVAQALELSRVAEEQRESSWSGAGSVSRQGNALTLSEQMEVLGRLESSLREPLGVPDGLAVRIVPRALRWLGDQTPEASPWVLFDGDPQTTIQVHPGEKLSLEIELAEEAWFDGVGFFGGATPQGTKARGRLGVRTTEGAVPGLAEYVLGGESSRWTHAKAEAPVRTRSVILDYEVATPPGSSSAALEGTVSLPGEWSLAVRGRASTYAAGGDAEAALHLGNVDGGSVFWANAGQARITRNVLSQAGPQLGQFEVELPVPPRAVGRAFLVYELSGVPHFASVPRAINGGALTVGQRARPESPSQARMTRSGTQIEEISPSALREGKNRIEFHPADPKWAAEYAVGQVRLVVLAPSDARLSFSGEELSGRVSRRLSRPLSGTEMAFELGASTEEQLEFVTDRGQRLAIDLKGLEPGWHRQDVSEIWGQLQGLLVRSPRQGSAEAPLLRRVLVSGIEVPGAEARHLVITAPANGECSGGEAYVRGFVRGAGTRAPSAGRILVEGQELPIQEDGSFEFSVREQRAPGASSWSLPVRAVLGSEEILDEQLQFQPCLADLPASAEGGLVADVGAPFSQIVGPEGGRLEWAGASLTIPEGALEEETKITLRPIPVREVAPLGAGMVNVTTAGSAFRLGPHGLQFKKPIQISLPYDTKLLPPAASERHIVGFYFDEKLGKWSHVGRGAEAESGRLLSLTDHFTDFINATVPVPDAPGAKSFAPDEMKGLEVASPTAGVTPIAPPSPNAQGSASVSYPLELPPGRMGMQPSLAISYSSGAGSSWLGEGWDLRLSSLELDTRFGVPDYEARWTQDPSFSVGDLQVRAGQLSYLLDGDPLVPDRNAASGKLFKRRIEGSFQRILRLDAGDVPGAHYFEVTSQDGVKYTYGKTRGARLADPDEESHVFRWLLEEVTDPFGNGIHYTYERELTQVGRRSPFLTATQLYPFEIRYTTHEGQGEGYLVRFHRRDDPRQDARVDGRAGFLVSHDDLLEQVDVFYLGGGGEQRIRSYVLSYEAGELGKTLLTNVSLLGKSGVKLYGHDFSYRKAPIEIFAEPERWGTVSGDLKSKTLRTSHGFGMNATVTAGFGLPGILSIQAGGGGGFTQTWRQSSFLDFSGDRLPDLLSEDDGLAWGKFLTRGQLGSDGVGVVADKGLFDSQSGGLGSSRLGYTRNTFWSTQVRAGFFFDSLNTSGYLGRSQDEDGHMLVDMNGDGLPDHVFIEKGDVRVALNQGEDRGFRPDVRWGALDLDSIVFVPREATETSAPGNTEREEALLAETFPVDPVIGWKAPFAGIVTISQPIRKKFAGGDGVRVRIYKQQEKAWDKTFGANDLSPCSPSVSDGCNGSPLEIDIGRNEYIHFRVSAEGTTKFDELELLPRITYTSVTSGEVRPYGKDSLVYDLDEDFRVAGGTRVPWHATGVGTVELTSSYMKPQTADEVELLVYRLDTSNKNRPSRSLVGKRVVSAAATTGSYNISSIPIGEDQTLEFVMRTDTVIDPEGLYWAPKLRFKTYWRPDPKNPDAPVVPKTVQCSPSVQPGGLSQQRCTVQDDPTPDAPLRFELIESTAQANIEIPVFTDSQPVEANNTASGGQFRLRGTLGTSDTDGAFLCQTPNRLIGKVKVELDGDDEEFDFSANLSSGEKVTCSVIARRDPTFISVDVEEVSGLSEDLEVTRRRIDWRHREYDVQLDRPGSMWIGWQDIPSTFHSQRRGLSGGFHRWFFGDWNGAREFDEDRLLARMAQSSGDSLEAQDQPKLGIAIPARVGLTSQPGADETPVEHPGWVGRGGSYITRDRIAPGRGTPGFGYGVNGRVDSLRASHTWNYGVGVNLFVVGIGLAAADSTTDQELVDMNGDGLPDSLTAQGVRYNTGCRTGSLEASGACSGTFTGVNQEFNQEISHSESRIVKITGGVSSGTFTPIPSQPPKVAEFSDVKKSEGGSESSVRAIYNGGFSVGMNYGGTSAHRTLADVNGDGLVDYVSWSPNSSHGQGRRILVRLNLGYRLSDEVEWDLDLWNDWNGDGVINQDDNDPGELFNQISPDGLGTVGATVGAGLSHFKAVSVNSPVFGDTGSASVGGALGVDIGGIGGGVSMGYVNSVRREISSLVDVTGDGLPDYVVKQPKTGKMFVRVNQGKSFSAPQVWQVPTWEMEGGDIDDELLTDLFYGTDPAALDVLGFERSRDYQVTTDFNFCFLFCIGASVTATDSVGHGEMSLDDVNGDGFVDFVMKQKGKEGVFAKLNQLTGVNLLEKIERPWGGDVEIGYKRHGNTYQDASSHIVMASVTTRDGRGNVYQETHSYTDENGAETGVTDRHERDFFLFGQVTTTRPDHSEIVTKFENGDFYRKGLPVLVSQRSAGRAKYVETTYSYNDPSAPLPGLAQVSGSAFPAELSRTMSYYEGGTTAGVTTSEQREWFGTHGGLKKWTRLSDVGTEDDLIYEIAYQTEGLGVASAEELYLVRANSVVAKGRNGQTYREREASYDSNTGALLSVTNYITGGENPNGGNYTRVPATTTILSRDAYGNVTSIRDPNLYELDYEYDGVIHAHVVETEDSFGYVSRAAPNYLFGGPASVQDINGHSTLYEYDDFGRLARIWGPNDVGTGVPTIRHQYALPLGDGQTVATFGPLWAKTGHKDVVRNPGVTQESAHDFVETASFIDGLGRVIQTKKDLEKDFGDRLEIGTSVSGGVRFDLLGRVQEVGQPKFSQRSITEFEGGALLHPSTTVYDLLDRVVSVTTPHDEPGGPAFVSTLTTYDFAPDQAGITRLRTTVTDPLGNRKHVLRDVEGSIVEVHEFNDLPGAADQRLVTSYEYNPVDELLKVTDAAGNQTVSSYDTLGRMVSLNNPDTGLTRWSYDRVGNLKSKETAQLRAKNQRVEYDYEHNRLERISYPETQDKVFAYGEPNHAGDANGNRAGRILEEESEAGVRELRYDRLGNVTEMKMSYHRMREPHLGNYTFQVGYDFDSFGRVLKTRFPRVGQEGPQPGFNEIVSYVYDAGGNLQSSFGQNTVVNPQHPQEAHHSDYLMHVGWDEFGQKVRQISGNFVETKYEYREKTRRLAGIDSFKRDDIDRMHGQPGSHMQQLRYEYDLVGNILGLRNDAPFSNQSNASVLVATTSQSFTYDKLYQLKSASGVMQHRNDWRYTYGFSQEYDGIGNITLKDQTSWRQVPDNGSWRNDNQNRDISYKSTYTYGGSQAHTPSVIAEQLPNESSAYSRAFTYDASGNQTQNTFRGHTRTIVWNEDDQIKQVIRDGQELNRTLYDAQGQRAVHLHRVSGMEETAYLGPNLTIRDGKYVTKHVFAGSERVSSKMDPAWFQHPPTLYFHSDHLGSAQYVTTNNEEMVQHAEYLPSGELWQNESDSRYELARRFLFTGKELDINTGLYDFGARSYDARQGQWLSPDPILVSYMRGRVNNGVYDSRNISLYSYAWNQSVQAVDPNGQFVVGALIAAGVALGVGFGGYWAIRQLTSQGGGLPAGTSEAFDSADSARHHRDMQIAYLSDKNNEEHSAVTFELNGKYYHSEARTKGYADDAPIPETFVDVIPNGAILLDYAHTHPVDRGTRGTMRSQGWYGSEVDSATNTAKYGVHSSVKMSENYTETILHRSSDPVAGPLPSLSRQGRYWTSEVFRAGEFARSGTDTWKKSMLEVSREYRDRGR